MKMTRLKQWFAAAVVAGAGVWSANAAMTHSAAVVDTRADVLAEVLPASCSYALSGEGLLTVKFAADASGVQYVLPDNMGPLAFDLNGKTITGKAGTAGSASAAGGNGAWVFKVGSGTTISVLDGAGSSGRITGGKGGNGHPAGAGAFAFVNASGAQFAVMDAQTLVSKGADGAAICVVTLNAQGGAGGTASVAATYGAAMPSATMPTKAGYAFLGYFDAQTDGVKYYNADGTSAANWDKTENTTLYAQWQIKSYTLTLDLAGGSGVTSTSVTCGQVPAMIEVPTKDGRKFLGFFTEADGEGTRIFDEYGIAHERWMTDAGATLHAYWANELWTSAPVSASFDIREVKPATMFKPETLTSSPKGWEADADTDTAVILDAIAGGEPLAVVDSVTANATVWTPQSVGLHTLTHSVGKAVETAKFLVEGFTYTVAFDANGGTGAAMEGTTLAYGAEGTAPACTYTRADYSFDGWNTRKDGTGADIAAGGAFSNLVTRADEVGILYAIWRVVPEQAVNYAVDVSEGGQPASEPILVPNAWLDENLPPGVDKTDTAKVKAELEKPDPDTGLMKWQEYVLDVKPGDKNAKIWIDSPQQKSADKIKVKMKELSPTKGSGFTVKYRLDTELKGQEKAKGDLAASPDFDIDVSGDKDPSGLYTINVVFVPEGKENSDEVVESVNTMGILKVPSAKALEIVAVPWSRLAPDENQSVLVADLVKTATLTPGDKLHVYDRAKRNYKSWSYDVAQGWVALGTFRVSASGLEQTKAPDQTEQTVARGSAVWLERQDASKPFYLYGQYSKDEVETKVEKNQHNLVACPKMEPFHLNDGRITGTINANDQIIVPNDGGVPKVYSCRNGKWGYSKITEVNGIPRSQFVTEGATVPVGTGFWYVSKGGSPTIRW